MWGKFKTLSVSLLLCYLPQANAINIIFGERNPVCLEAINRMNQDPHFFERASKEQYHYLLLESPFKRDYFEYVPIDMAYPLFLQQEARHLKDGMNVNTVNETTNELGYYILNDAEFGESDYKRLIYNKQVSAEDEASLYYYKDEDTNAFAYKTNIQLSDKLHIIGVVADLSYHADDRWSIPIQYFIVDEYMHVQPKVLEQYYDFNKDYYDRRDIKQFRHLYYLNGQNAFLGVPVDLMGETLAMQVYVNPYTQEFKMGIFRNVYDDGYIGLEPICEYIKVIY